MFVRIPTLDLVDAVVSTGNVPVLDLAGGATGVPSGNLAVRVRSTEDAPSGTGAVFAAAGAALPGRECWFERVAPGPAPDGFVGVVLRGLGSGGRSGDVDVQTILAQMPGGVRVLLDWPHPPGEPVPVGAEGIVLGEVLAGFWPLGPRNRAVLDALVAADLRRVGGLGFASPIGGQAHRRAIGGEGDLALFAGWMGTDDWAVAPIPGGAGLLHAAGFARRMGTIAAALAAYAPPVVVSRIEVVRSEAAPVAPAPEVDETVLDVGAHEPVAIVGLGCRLPDALSVPALWSQLTAGFDAIREVPVERWDPRLFWDPDKSVPDKTYAKIGAFVRNFTFSPKRFRVPPSVARLIDPVQQMALEAAADALDDAGYPESRSFDRERVAVILGQSMGGEITDEYTLRVMFPAMREALARVPGFAALPVDERAAILATYEEGLKATLPPITEDSMPGELANVVAGRITNALNLGGPNFTTDAACAGSMAAMQTAVKALQDHDVDMALTGGADRSMGVATYTKFSKIGALSPDGSRPFDANANGFVMGEGVGILVIKRLSDALRDGDRIYAVIRSFGGSSDGRGKGITAPNPEGQKRALRRAYENAGVDPADVDLFECHGTSTNVGDKVEVEALGGLIGAGRRAGRPARIGSIKSNIGHLKSAAGAASALKTALALHHGVLPPSINYRTPRKDLALDVAPLQVQTQAEAWASPRFAGISAFGFGGTNFHMVMESTASATGASKGGAVRVRRTVRPESIPAPVATPAAVSVAAVGPAAPASAPVSSPRGSTVPVPEGLWALSADTPEELIAKCRALRNGRVFPYDPAAPLRIAAAAADDTERDQQLDRAIATLQKGKGYDLLRQRGVAIEDVPCDGQLAFLFTGQGSQYLEMGLDLAARYPIVADTFREADAVMEPLLGRPLTSYIRRDPSMTEEEQFDALRATEISQPATLTVDVAILRLMAAWGITPDVVAGHSLGEYGAAVAAGMLSFRDALVAVSARGREMAAVKLDDFGKMAGIATSVETVMEVLAEVPGYVVPANKNCPTQTVIAGESDAVDAAIELFKSRGITVYPLPVSHAFHSRIVAPASEPLRRVLEGLALEPPKRRITTNVSSRYYPSGPDARAEIIDIMARQVASPVEWIAQVERMYADGARIFVECGPKRALAGFVVSILKHRPHRALYTNQPKRGGVLSFLDSVASLFVLGFPVQARPEGTADLFAAPGERRATSAKLAARAAAPTDQPGRGTPAIEIEIRKIVAAKTGYPVEALDLDFDVEADLGIDTVKLADIIATVREHFRLEHDPNFKIGDHRTLRALVDYAGRRMKVTAPASMPERRPAAAEPVIGADAAAQFLQAVATQDLRGLDAHSFADAMLPALQGFLRSAWEAFSASHALPGEARAAVAPVASPPIVPSAPTVVAASQSAVRRLPYAGAIVCSGASLGLPAGEEVFAPDNVQRMLRGENRIINLDEAAQDRFLAKQLVRLVKDPQTGQGTFLPVTERQQVVRLAGVKARFDLGDYGVDPALSRSLDIATQLAFAAGLEALRDAGIPLVRTWHTTKSGKSVATGWALPPSMRDGTGIVFASAFPGYDQLIQKLRENGGDGEGNFDRRFLFQILAMGHSQFAQYIGARGPNTQVNAACASTTQGVAIAEDWLRMRRADRVIVLGADDVTNENLLEWIGSGFMAAGAATTEEKVELAALPFDRRRHGMILGMGAVGLILERDEDVRARGMAPIAELLGAHITNSAFHGTRLDAEHISREVVGFADVVTQAAGVSKEEFARACVFLSHETYTPARGGSAAAEMASLPAAFGPAAKHIVVANTKGYTGHPMGAGIEDTVAVKALQYQTVPPIPNLKEPDPDLGELTLSQGGHYPVRYALRLAAGFGSQLALSAWKKLADGDARILDRAAYDAWLQHEGGPGSLGVEHRVLRWTGATPSAITPPPVAPAPAAAVTPPPASAAGVREEDVLRTLVAVIARRSGYAVEEIDPTYELEADLGIDTVKQAEIFGEVRETYALPRDDSFRLADYPTVQKLAGWLTAKANEVGGVAPIPTEAPPVEAAPPEAAPPEAPAAEGGGPSREDVMATLLGVVSRRTGYAVDELDPSYELEADLGIDTVKQAEIFGEVREAFALPRDDNFRLADHPTLDALADWLTRQAAGTRTAGAPAAAAPAVAPAVTPSPVVPPAAEKVAPSTESVPEGNGGAMTLLVEVIARRTGYAPEELDPTFELEADLGIDTVKQAEIFGEVRERLSLPRDDNFRLADHPTIAALGAWLQARADENRGGEAAPAEAAPDASAPPDAEGSDAVSEAPADAEQVAPSAAPEAPAPTDDTTLPPSVRMRRPLRVVTPLRPATDLTGQKVLVLGDTPVADALRAEVVARGAQLDEQAPTAVIEAGIPVMDAFRRARAMDGAPPARWLCVLDRRADLRGARDAGARAGLCKALGREWSGTTARVVDVSRAPDPAVAAAFVADELGESGGAVEVWVGGPERLAAVLETEPIPTPAHWVPHQTWLLTGGTRGITARVALEVARRGPCRLVLVARTLPGDDPLDEVAERARIKAALESAGKRATPKLIEDGLKPLRVAEEARVTVETLRSLGAEVEVFACNLADSTSVHAMLEHVVDRFGRIDVCVHGAGVEESRKIADKDDAAWSRVFDGKAIGGLALVEALPETTSFVSMGSIAGRFGNAGQVDYSAANEAMAQVCHAHPNALHVCWTAWGDVGMAARGGMEELLTGRGVELLPAGPGAALLCDLVGAHVTGEVVVAGRLGDFATPALHPLLDTIEHVGDGVVARRALTVSGAPWIVDHAIDGVPVLPGVIGLEMMVGAALAAWPRGVYVGAEDVRFDAPVKIYKDEPTQIEIEATPEPDGIVRCVLRSRRTARTGRVLQTDHFSARIVLEEMPLLPVLPSAFFPEEPIDREAIYARFFHGPRFRVLEEAEAVAVQGLLARASVEHAGIAHGLCTDPLVLEAVFQAAGLHRMAMAGMMALPASVDTVERVRAVADGEPLTVVVVARDDAYDIDVDGAEGRVMRVRGFRLVDLSPLPPGATVPVPEGGWPSAALATATEAETNLDPSERSAFSERGTPRRVADRLAGQLAANRAVAALARRATFRVVRGALGVPMVEGADDVRVSITHQDGEAMALAVRAAYAGIDAEEVSARDPSFTATWFTPEEQARFADPEAVTAVWAVKEAVLKALGLGLTVSAHEVEVTALAPPAVCLRGAARDRHEALGASPIRVRAVRRGRRVVATAVFAA